MALATRYLEVEVQTILNPTALAAGGQEEVLASTLQVNTYNRLLVTNLDAVNIRVFLDGDPARSFDIQQTGGNFQIEPDDGIFFRSLQQKNLDSATAETAGKITFRVAKAIPR